MDEVQEMSENLYCFGCLCQTEERSIQCFVFQSIPMKNIFQIDKMSLCYVCKRAAQHAESFIQNVQSNQILLENIHSLSVSTLQSARNQSQPNHQLSQRTLDVIELHAEDTNIEESYSVIYNSRKDVKVKVEMKEEIPHTDDEFVDDDLDNDYQESYVKEEDFPLKALLKEELELEVIDLKRLKKTLRKGKLKKTKEKQRIKEEKEDLCKIETLYITRDQCMEERAKRTQDRSYISSVYKCEDCIKGFNFKASYDKHMEKHDLSNGEYECDICKQRVSTEEKLLSHKRYHEVRYRCSVCGLTRISRLTVKDHFSAFHNDNYYQYSCPHCSKVFKRQVSWRKHIAYAHTHNKRVSCAYCSKTYANKDALKAHMIAQHPKEVSAGEVTKKHVCQECGMAFKAPSQLKIHGIKHSISRDYYCVECDKSFKSESILKHHLKTASTHVSYINLPLPCQHCEKRFAIRRDLDRHTNRVHLNIKPFRCDRCDKAYVNAWSLNEHKRLIHEGYKRPLKYPCPMCDKAFDRNQILKGHIRTHTGERPFQCKLCPAQFSQASILGTHVRLIHLKLTRDGRPKTTTAK